MVGNVFGKDDEGDRHVGNRHRAQIPGIQICQSLGGLQEGEVRHLDECVQRDAVRGQCPDRREVNDAQGRIAGGVADYREDGRGGVTSENPDDKRDQADLLAPVSTAQHGHKQCDQTAQDGNLGGFTRGAAALQIPDGIAGQAQADDGNRRPDNHRRHQFVDPAGTDGLDRHGNHDIDETCADRTENQTGKSGLHTDSPGKGGTHRSQEGKRRAQKYRALELRKQNVSQGSHAGAE